MRSLAPILFIVSAGLGACAAIPRASTVPVDAEGQRNGAFLSAGGRLEPDSVKRRLRGEYSATLRDRVGAATFAILR